MNPTTIQEPGVAVVLAHKALLNDDGLFDRITARIRLDHEFQARFGELEEADQFDWSERILNETLAFLKLCSLDTRSFSPSELVDIGWHEFMLHSRAYMDFCEDVCGRYVHHEPLDAAEIAVLPDRTDGLSTTDAMTLNGIEFDSELWGIGAVCTAEDVSASAKCNANCRNGGGHK